MAKTGKGNARVTIQQSQRSRAIRNAKRISMAVFTDTGAAGEGVRKVYDCQHGWVQRVGDPVRSEGDRAKGDQAVDNVFDFIGKVREYFKTLGRSSYDNLGSDIISNVHFGADYNNAFWDGDELTFGDGDGTIFVSFANSLEVVAHEFSHGVTQFTANLEYYGQSGALNESFSDVFGSAITQYVNGQDAESADWLIGDEIMGPELHGESLRSMKAPGTAYDNAIMGKDPQPDHMDNYFTGSSDNQGVHINSGIPNKAFYLAAMAIGTDPAASIWYHALQNLWATAVFNDAVAVIAESARILTKEKKAPLGSTQAMRAAFKTVGLPR
jgi:Zn-dependent metalloprotease